MAEAGVDKTDSAQRGDIIPAVELSDREIRRLGGRRPTMYVAIFVVWALTVWWFSDPLAELVMAGDSWWLSAMLLYFVAFVAVAWLYGVYNIAVVVFARTTARLPDPDRPIGLETPAVAVLYTTYNDFSEAAARTCVELDYPDYTVYLLDDSTDPAFQARVDEFAADCGDRVRVIRRPDREGFKAGNLNHALEMVVDEPLFVVVDADERMPTDFLSVLVPQMMGDESLGFIQANHRCLSEGGDLQADLAVGVDVHWKWYQPLRNRYGFVMFLGHGAIIRRDAWLAAGGFPELVSEDLAFAIVAREHGYVGAFEKDVVCWEEFPATVRDFRRRHVKWSRGTAEFLHRYAGKLIRSRRISATEKADILFPTVNLPLTLFFFVFMLVGGLGIPLLAGTRSTLTVDLGVIETGLPVFRLPEAFTALHRWDIYLVTLITIVSPLSSFILDLWRQPLRLARFLGQSTALYATLAPLTAMAIIGYLFTRRAQFIVTGDRGAAASKETQPDETATRRERLRHFLSTTDPDSDGVRRSELWIAVVVIVGAAMTYQIALVGIGVGYLLVSRMHRSGWDTWRNNPALYAPAAGIAGSTVLGASSLVGFQPAFFGLSMFHF